MLLCTLSKGKSLHPVLRLGDARTEVTRLTSPVWRQRPSSLGEIWDLKSSIWQPGHCTSWLDDLEVKNANNASLPKVSWHKRTNSIHSFLNIFLSLPVWLCHSFSSCHSVFPSLSFVLHSRCWLVRERVVPTETGCAVCQPAADVPGGAPLSAEVLNKESLGPGAGGQAVSLSALGVTPLLLLGWCLPVLSLTTWPPSLIHPLLARALWKNRKKNRSKQ